MRSILNFIFTIVFYPTCIYFKTFLNQFNLFYIFICLYLQYILKIVFTVVFYATR
jgi:hypothetical protein